MQNFRDTPLIVASLTILYIHVRFHFKNYGNDTIILYWLNKILFLE